MHHVTYFSDNILQKDYRMLKEYTQILKLHLYVEIFYDLHVKMEDLL